MPRLQSWQLSPHACNTGADQDWSLTSLKEKLLKIGAKVVSHGRYARFTNGGRRHPTTNVPGDTAANRGTTAAATTRAVQEQSTGGMRPDASENSQISSSIIVRAARAAGSHPHLASVLRQGRKSANICVSLLVI
jgi:hypothetical protein